jgi:3-oxoacyl-[acyl-carrier protein] reductase
MGLLEAKVALITGGGQGIGYSIAQRLSSEGAAIIIADMNLDSAQQAAKALVADGVQAIGVGCDVTHADDVERAVLTSVASFGGLDVLVNNAGITRDSTMKKMTEDSFRTVLDVHLTGAWLCTKHASAVMRERNSGSIVNVSSIAGKVGNFGQTNYSAAKAGMIGLTKASAKELARVGVRVNAVQPGLIRTAMTEAMPTEAWEQKMSEIPMARAGEPAEVASAVLFLASDLASYMTGAVLEVTGGRYM